MRVFSRNFRDALSSRWGVRVLDGLFYDLVSEPAGIARQGSVEAEYPAHVRLTLAERRTVAVLDLESAARLRDDLDKAIGEAEALAGVVTGRTYSAPSAPLAQTQRLA